MKRLALALLALLALVPPAVPQQLTGIVFPPRSVLGNPGSQSDFGQAVPFANLTALLPRSALTQANDTNVTLTLSGSPATALFDPVTLTMGWAGQLALARGGSGVSAGPMIYVITAATVNMNSVADTTFTITLPAGFSRYRIQNLIISHASVDLTAATTVHYGLFTSAGGGGTAAVSDTATTVSSAAESTSNNAQYIAPSITATFNNSSLFFRVITAHGSAATADVALQIQPLL